MSREPQAGPPQPPPEHPRAVTSLVLGILSVVLCALIGPFAWRFGRRTLIEIDVADGEYGGRGMAQAGYLLGIIGTVLLIALLTILLVVLIGSSVALFGA